MAGAAHFFSRTTVDADARFAAAARRAGAEFEAIRHPLAGPAGEPLHVSVARIGAAGARRVLLVLSGTHGVEGLAGAGLQTGLISTPSLCLPGADTAMLFVHLINPWGAAWIRREDHANIDLFRNFLYWQDPITPDPLFDAIDDLSDLPRFAERTPEEHAALWTEALRRFGSKERIVAAIRRGQHHRPRSMTYHGTGPCWSCGVLEGILRKQLRGCRELAVLDVHTGYGDYGAGLVMAYDPPGDARHERLKQWMGGSVYVPGCDADIPAHAKSPYGFIADWVPGVAITAAILEYGTFNLADDPNLIAANHYYHVFGDPLSPAGRAVGARYRRYFYPESDDWTELIWRRGIDVVGALLRGLEGWNGGAEFAAG